jgi:hypothetical protein
LTEGENGPINHIVGKIFNDAGAYNAAAETKKRFRLDQDIIGLQRLRCPIVG